MISSCLGKRLQEAKKNANYAHREPNTTGDHGTQFTLEKAGQIIPWKVSELIGFTGGAIIPSSQNLSFCPSSAGQVPSLSYELPYQFTVHGALYINGEILGLKACFGIPMKSPPASSEVPLSLQPTQAQLITVHYTGIDRFPFPKMRENAINLSSIIDEEELARDFYLMPTFTISPGASPWDPRAWKIEKPFADKWGFLFY